MKETGQTSNKTLWKIFKIIALVVMIIVLSFVSLSYALQALDRRTEKVAKQIIDPKAAAYIAQTYPGKDFIPDSAYYAFKDNCYRVKVHSPSSPDTYFNIDYHYTSHELVEDSYEANVASGYNTRERLTEAYANLTKECLDTVDCLYLIDSDFCKYSENTSLNKYFSPDGLDSATLILDYNYDVAQMGAQYGYLKVSAMLPEENINILSALELLTEIDKKLIDSGIGYSLIEITIEDARYPDTTSQFYLYGVRPEDLHREDSLSYLQELWNEQEANRQATKENWQS